jgi:uncharacterized repeat protein (TIGR03809 family)
MALRQELPAPISPTLAKRWLALAEQRRDNFVELYETGRWRRYYTEEQFLQRMKQAIELIESWKRHAGGSAEPFALDHAPITPDRSAAASFRPAPWPGLSRHAGPA